ncbi:MAG: FixH family protein [bacterium]|nr:FixH family protein [bacterium]
MSEANWKLMQLFGGAAALFCTLLIALGFKIYYALDTHQPVMTGDYYEIGRNFDEYRRKNRSAVDRSLSSPVLGATGEAESRALKPGENLIPVVYQATPGSNASAGRGEAIAGARVSLSLSRRATVNQDVSAECLTDERGRCQLRLFVPGGGYWEGRLRAADPEGEAQVVLRRVFDVAK